MKDKNSFCLDCFKPFIDGYEWCKKCNAKRFQQNFSNWTSENEFIDKFIQESQLNTQQNQVLEWIPYDKLENVEYFGKREFSIIYKAILLDGPIEKWSYNERKWIRYNDDILIDKCYVELHSLKESSNLSENFLNEV